MKESNILKFSMTLDTTNSVLEQLATVYASESKTTIEISNNRVNVPSLLGDGYVICIPLLEGLTCILSDIMYHVPAFIERRVSEETVNYVAGCAYGHSQTHVLMPSVPGEHEIHDIKGDGFFMYSTQSKAMFMYEPGKRTRSFTLVMSRSFLLSEMSHATRMLNHPFMLHFVRNEPLCFTSSLHPPLLNTVNGVFEDLVHKPYPDFVKRFMCLSAAYSFISKWFIQEYEMDKMPGETSQHVNINDLMKVKDEYVSNFEAPPLTIETLARKCNMSLTKFKIVFKSVFGMSCYQYYQSQRMQYARDLLCGKQHSIKEVAYMTGFENTANFTRSFKKSFGELPRDYVKHRCA